MITASYVFYILWQLFKGGSANWAIEMIQKAIFYIIINLELLSECTDI